MAGTRDLSKFVEFGKKIIAVGRNYSEHAAELGNAVPDKPMLFMKPTSAYVTTGGSIEIPHGCRELHHEIELGVVIGQKGNCIPEAAAMKHVGGYAVALDMTARDFQNEAKKKGHPWILAKGFDTSCPVSPFIEKERVPDPHNLNLWCTVNGRQTQKGNTKDMIFTIPVLISYISKYFTLEEGDLLLTGTPAGVGPVNEGDVVEGGLSDLITIKFPVKKRQ